MDNDVFFAEETPYYPGKYVIKVNGDKFYMDSTTGSFNVICARLMGLHYADYCRFCRDVLGATIVGKNSRYPAVYFPKGENLSVLVRLLNTRANFVRFNREHPDFDEHAQVVIKYREKMREARKNVPNPRDSARKESV